MPGNNAPVIAPGAEKHTMKHRVDLFPETRDRARMKYGGIDIGVSFQPLFDAARYLLDHGLANPADRVETYRNETLCLAAPAGIAAQLAVRPSSLKFYRYCSFAAKNLNLKVAAE